MELGQYLKNVREQKGISLGQVADITKISISQLETIETGNFGQLPSRVFARGFVKSYAKCIGLNPDGAAASFDSISNAAAKIKKMPAVYRPKKAVVAESPKVRPSFKFQLPKANLSNRAAFFIVAAVVIILAAIFSL